MSSEDRSFFDRFLAQIEQPIQKRDEDVRQFHREFAKHLKVSPEDRRLLEEARRPPSVFKRLWNRLIYRI